MILAWDEDFWGKWTSTSMLSFLFSPGKEPGPGADICELHLQLLPGCSTQLFCFRGPDDGLFPSTPGEPGHCGPTSHRCHHPGGPGWTAGAGLCGAVRTVRTVWPMCCTGTTFINKQVYVNVGEQLWPRWPLLLSGGRGGKGLEKLKRALKMSFMLNKFFLWLHNCPLLQYGLLPGGGNELHPLPSAGGLWMDPPSCDRRRADLPPFHLCPVPSLLQCPPSAGMCVECWWEKMKRL